MSTKLKSPEDRVTNGQAWAYASYTFKLLSKLVKKHKSRFEISDEEAFTSVLVDLRHYCDLNSLTYGDLDKQAQQNYLLERSMS